MKKTLAIIGLFALMGCASLIPLKVVPPTDVAVEITPERLTYGEYLSKNVAGCSYCHSPLNWDYYAGGLPEFAREGSGGYRIAENMGLMGSFDIHTPNITPAAVGNWTDGELIRAIVEGVNKNGEPLFPIMPYGRYINMDEEDLYSIVAYIRSLKPISNTLPKKKIKRMFKLIERTFPKPYDPRPKPDPSDKTAYGKYLATIGDCISCHTTSTKSGKPIEGMEVAGGNEYKFPGGGIVRAANLTPDTKTGIGNLPKDNFIALFRNFQESKKLEADRKQYNTVMPWPAYSGMTDEDLGAIYEYLRSVPPVNNKVEKWPKAESN